MKNMQKFFFKVLSLYLFFSFFLFSNQNLDTKILAATIAPKDTTNYEYTFTSIKGDTISTKTDQEQTTILIFGHTNCSNSRNTVKNIAKSNWVNNPNIRVIFAECNCGSLEVTKAFAQAYGSDAITFCYDTRYSNSIKTAMWDYYDLYYSASGGGALPFTVLIDKNNQVQNVLTGNCSADAIWRAINEFTPSDTEQTNPCINLEITGTENYTYANEILALVNQTRTQKGLPALKLDQKLLESAMERAAEISLYYGHTRPNGSDCFTIFNRGTRRSENIAAGYNSPQAVMNAWNGSSGHYQNIVDPYVTSIGIGCFQDSKGNLYWVQLFDNDPAVPSISENKQVNRIISIQKNLLHLQTNTTRIFYDTELNQSIAMEIYHKNEEFNNTEQKVLLSNFNFESSNPSVATISDEGMITLKGLGSTVMKASLKEDDSIILEQTITINTKTAPDNTPTMPNIPDLKTSSPADYTTATPDVTVLNTASPTAITPDVPVLNTTSPTDNTTTISNVSNLKAESKTNSIKLTWDKISKAKGYLVYQYDTATKKWKKIAGITANTPSYTVKKLSSTSVYRFAVKAYKIQNEQQITSKTYTSLYVATKPSTVTFRLNAGKKKVSLKWDKIKSATGYRIYYKTNASNKWIQLKDTKGNNYIKKNLISGKDYFFTIRAYKTYQGKIYIGNGISKKVTIK